MAQLNDTMVQGDLRVTGKIYGTDNAIRLENANLAIPPLGAGDYVGSTGDFFIPSGSGKNLPITTNNFNIHTTVTRLTGTTYRLSQIATPTASNNPGGIYERSGISSDGVTWTFGSWVSTYIKPSGGIPSTDMSSAVQTSLTKADNAIPSSQKGAASGVGTLDANGVQPYSETYKGYYNSADTSSKVIKIGRFKTGSDTRDAGGVSFSIVCRGPTDKSSGQILVWLSTHNINTRTKCYKTVLFNRGAGIDDNIIKVYTHSVTESSVNYVDLYATIGTWCSVRIVPLWGNPDTWTPVFTTASLPSGAAEVSNTIFVKSAGAAGSESVPVHIDAAGNAATCNVGVANGLASLGSNGVQPYSEMYKGYVVSGDAVFKLCRIPKDANYGAGVSFAFTSRVYNKASGQVLLWISPCEWENNSVQYKVVNLFARASAIDMKFFYNEVTVSGSTFVDVYYRVYGSSNTHVMPLWMRPGVQDMLTTGAVTLPDGAVEMSTRFFNVCAATGGVGSGSTPVYVNNVGNVQACTSLTPIPTSYSAASATKGYKIATVENSDGGDPMYAGCMIAVCLRDNGGADCQIILSVSFSEYSNGANVGPVSGKAFTLHNRITTIGAIRFFVNKVSASKYDIYAYTNGSNNYLSCQCISGKGVTIHSSPSPETITISNMTELTRSRAVVAQSSGQIGSSTQAIYMDEKGVLQPCQSGLSLNFEAVSSIPASPVVGKLYAL